LTARYPGRERQQKQARRESTPDDPHAQPR
jgi:hypothetical protein